ncbi:sulfotransferase family protein [Coraliomargarita parva]|uniref:sulfotransferase family protein n=1 Tax=Coraliomargarita parva TaxID=3014050 RepID=UPI0022B34B2D|nr:sulfotransferase [Coraliomargarita parva]
MSETEAPSSQVEYSSLFARLFFKSFFENQWVIPEPPPKLLSAFLRWYEGLCMRVDLTEVPVDRPVFIISLPRSGSSMLQDVLCSHPAFAYATNMMDICRKSAPCAAEHFRKRFGFNIRGERFLKDSVLVDGGSPADPVATWADIFGEDYFHVSAESFDPDRLDAAMTERAQRHVREVLWSFGRPYRRFFCKTPLLLPYAEVLRRIFPDARFIHLIRDPRSTANSMVKIHRLCNEQLALIRERQNRPMPEEPFVPYPRLPNLKKYLDAYGPEDVSTTAHLWNEAIGYVDRIRDDFGEQLMDVRYEDILSDPDGQLEALFKFAEVPVPDASYEAYQTQRAKIGRVHHVNRYGDYSRIESICAEGMARYGYR